MDKRKLNYRFHNPNPPEAVGRELLQICIGANIKKVESAVRESVEKENTLRIVAVDKSAQVARLKELPSDSEIKLLDEMQQECENLIIDEFVKAVAGKGEKEYEVKFRLPSAIYAEQIKNSPIIQTNTQFVK